jgi:ABC-type polysaccharide/polyol phosphate export permease
MKQLIHSIINHWELIGKLIKRDLISSYSGSIIGRAWLIIDPIVYILITLVFFQFAVGGAPTSGVPYVAWVLPAIIFWTFLSSAINSSIGSVKEYSFLLRHKNFDLRSICLIKLCSAAFIHIVLMSALMIILVIFMNVGVGIKTITLLYYFFSMCMLLIAINWLLSALAVFWKDIKYLVSIFLQVEFWISPIFWEPDKFPKWIALIMYINPFYYPMHGYRQAVMLQNFGDNFIWLTIYFWLLTGTLLVISSYLFNKLSKAFGDV